MAFISIRQSYNLFRSTISFKVNRICFKNIFSLKFGTKAEINMKPAYFQHCKGEEKVNIMIHFQECNIQRILNFERRLCENLEIFLQRLDQRVQSIIERKSKKVKKKNEESMIVKNFDQKPACLLLNDQQLPSELKFQDIFQNNFDHELKLRILDVDYNVLLNFPIITNMNLPKLILVGTIICPEAFTAQFTDKKNSNYTWFKSVAIYGKAWKKCGEGSLYVVKEEDKNYFLKLICVPKMDQKVGPAFEVVSKTPVQGNQNFEEINKRIKFTEEKARPNELRIVSYNVLADTYTQTKEAKTQLFTFCDPAYLDFNYRKNLLNVELLGYKADIMCLQEVDVKLYEHYLQFFDNFSYDCVFYEKEGTREGCLFIYDKSKFTFVNSNQYTFSKELLSNPWFDDIKIKLQDSEKLMQRLVNILSQIQVVVLETLFNDILVIGNTHFYFHPDADHIRLLQGVMSWKILLNEADELKKKVPNKRISIIICGDLNSTPECGFHQLLNTGSLGPNHIGWTCKEDEAIKEIECHHSVKMKSAYDNSQYTNFTPLFKGCIDYIYYQSDYLQLKQTVPIPSEDVLSRHSGIPSMYFPSDHVALIADLKFQKNKI